MTVTDCAVSTMGVSDFVAEVALVEVRFALTRMLSVVWGEAVFFIFWAAVAAAGLGVVFDDAGVPGVDWLCSAATAWLTARSSPATRCGIPRRRGSIVTIFSP